MSTPAESIPQSKLKSVIAKLREAIDGEVRFDGGAKAMYATDASNYRQVPIGVVIPKSQQDVIEAVRICREHDLPVLTRGGGTSLAGQTCNEAVVFDFSKYLNRVIDLKADQKTVRVEPGIVLDALQKKVGEAGLRFGPDPATHSRCTLGGMIGNDSCGVHSLFTGRTVHNVVSLKVLTYEGDVIEVKAGSREEALAHVYEGSEERPRLIRDELWKLQEENAALLQKAYPKIPRCVSGYALNQLLPENGFNLAGALVGSEGTCVTVLEATLKLTEFPKHKKLIVAGFYDICEAADSVKMILPFKPIGLEAFDQDLVENMRAKGFFEEPISRLPEGLGWLLIELGGEDEAQLNADAERLKETIESAFRHARVAKDLSESETEECWAIREMGPGAATLVPNKKNTWAGWEDAAVPPEALGDYLRQFKKLLTRFHYEGVLYGHFGDGCVHTRIDFDLESEQGIQQYRKFILEAAALVKKFKGSFSGEHGDGHARGELLTEMYGEEMVSLFQRFKTIWDPKGKMNPGKIVNAFPMEAHLRTRLKVKKSKKKHFFSFQADGGSFFKAVSRCVGIGKCRKEEGGLMCPSYMVTREEKHSTRGRARLLAEMLGGGGTIQNGYKSEEVKEALDLCLSCKGCKTECPTNVDMASYKAEFLARYYQMRLRPLRQSFFGRVDWGLRIISSFPGGRLANRFPRRLFRWMVNRTLVKRILRVHPKRQVPMPLTERFTRWHKRRNVIGNKLTEVLLWPDTFNNYLNPDILKAATYCFERIGFRIKLPKQPICCGRALYDQGMLVEARKKLKKTLRVLRRDILRGVPVVSLEPSCISVFRDELREMLPRHRLAHRLANQVFTFEEFFNRQSKNLMLKKVRKKAVMQVHCHDQAMGDRKELIELCKRIGVDCTILDAGCCGMAGAFGYEEEHYDISGQIAERALIPQLRALPEDVVVIADGFSCRTQIQDLTGKRAVHLAELVMESL